MPTNRPRHLLALIASLCTSQAMAQRAGQPNPRYLERQNPRAWVLDIEVNIRAYDNARHRAPKEELVLDQWEISQAAIVFPMVPSSASHTINPRATGGTVSFDDHDTGEKPKMEAQFPVGAAYGVWQISAPQGETFKAREMTLRPSISLTSYETLYHEDAAAEVEWPQKTWPDIAQSSFLNIPFIDFDPAKGPTAGAYDKEPVQQLLRQWTDGKDPRTVKPAILAKWLAGNVMQHVQITGQGAAFDRNGSLEGIQIQPPPITARRKRGSEFDAAALLASVYREAGLPARVVIAFGFEDEEDRDLEFLKGNAEKQLRAWTEFCLYDERDGTVTWIPVDIARMREKTGSRIPPRFLEQPQKYFGTHDELDALAPFSFHFFPPTTVRSYSGSGAPGFWGWLVAPASPARAFQSLRFDLKSASTRGG